MSELKSVYIDRTGDWCRSGNNTGKFYLKSEADEVIDEKDKEIEKYKTKYMELAKDHDHAVQACCDANKEIESLKASHYAEMVDAGMRERRLKRALWIAHAVKADFRFWWAYASMKLELKEENPRQCRLDSLKNTQMVSRRSERKCRAMAEENREEVGE